MNIQDEENTLNDGISQKVEEKEEKKDNKTLDDLPKIWKYAQHYPKELIIDDPLEKVKTHSFTGHLIGNYALQS